MMIRVFLSVILMASIITSINNCTAGDACRSFENNCYIDRELCNEVLAGQSQAVIDCIVDAETCREVHICLKISE